MKRSAEQLWTADLSNMRFVGSAPDLQSLSPAFVQAPAKKKKEKKKKKKSVSRTVFCFAALRHKDRTGGRTGGLPAR